MKKILAIILLAVSAFTTSAQMLKSRTLMKKERPTTWYVRLGMSIDNITGVGSDCDASAKVGMDLDFGFNKPMGGAGCYWGMDLGIITRGGHISFDRSDMQLNVNAWALKYTPFTFGYKYAVTDDIKLDGHLGVFASYDLSNSAEFKDEDRDPDTYFDSKFDLGIQAGIGVWWKKFNLDLSYQHGFMSPFVDLSYGDYLGDNSTSAFVIRLGYAF
ncbi:MAG: porin family protein [Duncaniella sp.]|nr:porin family protein [Duncaniella sp.]